MCYTRILSTEHTYTWAAASFSATMIKPMWLRLKYINLPSSRNSLEESMNRDFQILNNLWMPILSPLCLMQQITGSPGISVTIENYISIVYSSIHIVLCRLWLHSLIVLCRLWLQPNHLFIYLIPSVQLYDKGQYTNELQLTHMLFMYRPLPLATQHIHWCGW